MKTANGAHCETERRVDEATVCISPLIILIMLDKTILGSGTLQHCAR
jgi:hypothetical protein